MGDFKTVATQAGGWTAVWKTPELLGSGVLAVGQVPVSLSDSDVLTHAGAATHPWRASGDPFHLLPPCAGGIPRTCPGNNVVVVVLLPEGVTWHVELRGDGYVVGWLRWARQRRIIYLLSSCHRWHLFLLCSSCFIFGLDVLFAPTIVRCGCYINIAGRKPVSREAK